MWNSLREGSGETELPVARDSAWLLHISPGRAGIHGLHLQCQKYEVAIEILFLILKLSEYVQVPKDHKMLFPRVKGADLSGRQAPLVKKETK